MMGPLYQVRLQNENGLVYYCNLYFLIGGTRHCVVVLCYGRRNTTSHSVYQGMEVKTVSKNFPICQSLWCCVKLLTRGPHGKCCVQVLASYCVLGNKWTRLHRNLPNTPCNLCSHFDLCCSFFPHSCLQTRALRKCTSSQIGEGRKATETTSCPKGG